MGYKEQNGFTLIELIMVMAIIAVISVAGGYLMTFILECSVLIPNQLNANMVFLDAVDIMIEGDSQAKGLRFNKKIIDAQANQITFINQNDQTITFRVDPALSKIYRSVNGAPEALIPQYMNSNFKLVGSVPARMFYYYDSALAATTNPVNVRNVLIYLKSSTGNGMRQAWQASETLWTTVAVNKMQL